jgi:acetyl esterase/lipase
LGLFGVLLKTYFREGEEMIKHPDHIQDVSEAFKWTNDNIERYNGDNSQIFLMGHSAGAHLVTLLSLDTTYLENVNLPVDSIKGVIGISGVYNFDRLKQAVFGIGHYFYVQPLMHSTHDHITFHSDISPLTYARNTQFPFLLLNAKYDFHLQEDALELTESLRKSGVDVEHHENIHTHHGSIIEFIGSKKDSLTPLICDWMDKKMEEKKQQEERDEEEQGKKGINKRKRSSSK